MDPGERREFLTAEWRNMAILNYAVDPSLLAPLVPRGTELDEFAGKTYVSLVAFRFLHTRVCGVWIPLHSDFDEVNLRFYVKRREGGQTRRGVVFVKEVVPRYAVAKVARLVFHENYVALPMWHRIMEPVSEHGRVQAEYRWQHDGSWSTIRVECEGKPARAPEGSLEQFITEHYWGYTSRPDKACLEYEVAHDPWRIWKATSAAFEGSPGPLYGHALARSFERPPDSAFVAEGSSVTVYRGRVVA
jgi:uncharacterized protein